MKSKKIVPLRRSDTGLFIKLEDGCKCGDVESATLVVFRHGCCTPVRECAGRNACGDMMWRVTYPPVPTVTLVAATRTGGDCETQGGCCGWLFFPLTPEFAGLGTGRMDGTIRGANFCMDVQLQVFASAPRVTCHQTTKADLGLF